MTHIYFIRHAESKFIFDKEKERGLTLDGIRKSDMLVEKLQHINFAAIISSSYKRAIETVHPLSIKLDLNIDTYDELIERGIKGSDIKVEWEEINNAIKKSFDDIDYCLEGGETTREAQSRAIPLLKNLLDQYKGKSIAIGTHGNILTIILKYFDDSYGYNFWKKSKKPDIYKVSFLNYNITNVENMM
ncbi:MAG: histidine phosphatase family protein [Spirochaetaceae bacterium]